MVFVFDLLYLVSSLCVSAKSVNGGNLSCLLALRTEKIELEAEYIMGAGIQISCDVWWKNSHHNILR